MVIANSSGVLGSIDYWERASPPAVNELTVRRV